MDQLNNPMIYKIMSVFGFIGVLVPPAVVRGMNQLLKKDDFLKQVFIPTIVGLILLGISYYMLLKEVTDEIFFQILIGVTVILSVGINLGVIFMSMLRMRWAAD